MQQVGHSGGPLTDAILHAKPHPLHELPGAGERAPEYQKGGLFRRNFRQL